ncbi:MAG: hypothetical protein JSS81_16480 [Acidobacteria bacterium]|nr:hypothetical protein [Acidobacteriota bacterium]
MEIAFDAIGLEIPNETAFNDLAEDVGKRGEVSTLARKGGILHGRCLKFGAGLEVWTLFYESGKGELLYADCRPAFRARYEQRISPWILSESNEDSEAVIHGFIEDSERDVLFQLQNLTEVGAAALDPATLRVGLCGLAYRAEVFDNRKKSFWKSYDEMALNVIENENDWSLGGRIVAFEALRNPQSGRDLFWIYVDLDGFRLEMLVNQQALRGEKLQVGAYIEADVWLQGHILTETPRRSAYEGIDWTMRPADFWQKFKKPN